MREALVLVLVGCGRIGFAPDPDAAAGDPVDATDGATVDASPLTVTRVVLADVPTKVEVATITQGAVIDVTALAFDGFTVLAEVEPPVGAVAFSRNGEPSTELSAPFVSGGETDGEYNSDGQLHVGANTVQVTAYAGDAGASVPGPTRTVDFELALVLPQPPVVTGFALVDASDLSVLTPLTDGQMFALASLPTRIDVAIITAPSAVGSVLISGTGPWGARSEAWPPYYAMLSAAGFTPALGSYTLVATPYTSGRGQGIAGVPLSLTFDIVP